MLRRSKQASHFLAIILLIYFFLYSSIRLLGNEKLASSDAASMATTFYEIKEAALPINRFTMSVTSITFGESANIKVELFNDAGFVTTKYLVISGQDYADWTNDLPYLTNWVAAQLGFILV